MGSNSTQEKSDTGKDPSEAVTGRRGVLGTTGRFLRETRWLADLAVLTILALYMTLPGKLTFGPQWLVPALVLTLLVPLTLTVPQRHTEERHWQKLAAVVLIGVINAANILSLGLLVDSLLTTISKDTGAQLILEATKIWMTNVLVFALWYWEMDRGGPGERALPQQRLPDFVFTQMTTPELAPEHWTPNFIDYVYLSFTNATAFSPTDTLPLTAWAKLLMMLQSLTSLLTIALVASRAVNILGSP